MYLIVYSEKIDLGGTPRTAWPCPPVGSFQYRQPKSDLFGPLALEGPIFIDLWTSISDLNFLDRILDDYSWILVTILINCSWFVHDLPPFFTLFTCFSVNFVRHRSFIKIVSILQLFFLIFQWTHVSENLRRCVFYENQWISTSGRNVHFSENCFRTSPKVGNTSVEFSLIFCQIQRFWAMRIFVSIW